MKIFYCTFESIFDPIFDSQVIVFLENINSRFEGEKQKVYLIVFNSIGDFFKKNYFRKRKEIKKRLKGNCSFSVKMPYMYNFPYLFETSLFLNSMIAAISVVWLNGLRRKRIVTHCRTEIASFILLSLKRFFKLNLKVICDCRGIGSKEILYKLNNKSGLAASKRIERVERFAQSKSDYIFCVSNAFKKYIVKNASKRPEKIKVVPCCIDGKKFVFNSNTRKSVRAELGLEKKFVIIYAGSMNEWQLPEEMVNVFKIFKKKIKNSIFLILTGDYDFALTFMRKSGLNENDYIVTSKPPSEMGRYLQAGDLALIIREENEVNRVAFPVKFGEYVRSGIPVLNSITSDVGDLIKENGLGFIINDYREIKEIEKTACQVKEKLNYITSDHYKYIISNTAGEKITWDTYLDSIIEVYRGLFTGKDSNRNKD